MAKVNATIKETVSGIAVAKNFRQESEIFADFNQANVNPTGLMFGGDLFFQLFSRY